MAFDHEIATATVFMEASGEPPEGRLAVAWVLANRVASGRWGSTLTAVCLAARQFSCWLPGNPNLRRLALEPDASPVLGACATAVEDATSGASPDPTGGALFYANDSVTGYFRDNPAYRATATIGAHTFYAEA